jgi:Protein of unknown function (DUF3102)
MSSIGGARSMVRPPAELAPLIRRELAQGTAHYREAGRLLLEAKKALPHGAFKRWVQDHCAVSYRQASNSMRMAAKDETRFTWEVNVNGDPATCHAHYHYTLRDVNADPTTRRQIHPKRPRDEAEIDRMRELAHMVITAGFRAVALKLHPDHAGGSVQAMALLNKAREGLVQQVRRWLGSF